MIIQTSQTDTSFTYRCDWEYAQMENDDESANDPAEHFSTFFMVLDKAVFGHNKFNIVDTNLFRTAHGRTKYVRLDSSATSTGNNFYDLVEFCQDVVYSYQNCTYGNTNACSEGCDQCYFCMESFVITHCWEEYVWMGGGGGSVGTGGTGGGGGGTGGGGTPPNCNPPAVPFAKGSNGTPNNIVPDCEGGWEPVPEEEPIPVRHHEGIETIFSNPDDWDIQFFPPQTLPSWNDYNNNYPKDNSGCELSAPSVYEMAGGPLYDAHVNDSYTYGNACALRTSIALTKCGLTIPHIKELQANGSYRNVTKLGANGKYYFITANDLYWWMLKTFGAPPATNVITRSEASNGEFAINLPAENGIYIMRAMNSSASTGFGASGHATAYENGNAINCGHLYGSDSEVGGGIRDVSLWKLN